MNQRQVSAVAMNVLNVLRRLLDVEPKQASLLDCICGGMLIDAVDVEASVLRNPSKVNASDTSAPLFD